MERYCDLHVHSSMSDGDFTRREVIELAIDNGITTLAITDHNVPFLDRDELQAEYPNVDLITGSEVSVKIFVNGKIKEIHVIALDYNNTSEFVSFLANNRFHTKEYIDSIIIAIQINRRTKAYWRMSRTTTQLCAYRGVELVWIFVWFAIGG